MVSLRKMKIKSIRTPSFKRRGKKSKTANATDEIAEVPTVVIAPIEEDPLVEYRWDSSGTSVGSTSPSPEVDILEHDERRSYPGQAPEKFTGEEDEDLSGKANPADDDVETVATEVSVASYDPLPAGEADPSGEGAKEEKAGHATAEAADRSSLPPAYGSDGTLDLDAAVAATALDEAGCIAPAYAPLFCGCFGI